MRLGQRSIMVLTKFVATKEEKKKIPKDFTNDLLSGTNRTTEFFAYHVVSLSTDEDDMAHNA